MLEKARKDLEQMISFKENIAGGFVLDEVDKVLLERISRLELNDRESKQVLLSVDKGNGRVTATVAFIFCDKPSSYYNALPHSVLDRIGYLRFSEININSALNTKP